MASFLMDDRVQKASVLLTSLFSLIVGCEPGRPSSSEIEFPSSSGQNRPVIQFEECSVPLGIHFRHSADGAESFYFPAIMAGGGALTDFDGDGLLDVLLLDSRRSVPKPQTSDASGPLMIATDSVCHLFLQTTGGTFSNATRESGLLHFGYATGCTAGDINNDGRNDLYITAAGADRLYVNLGDGRFRDVTEDCGIVNSRWSTSVALIDYDRDGWLDIFVTNYVQYDPGMECGDQGQRPDYCNPAVFPRTSDRLFRNITGEQGSEGGVKFVDVSVESGIAAAAGAGLGVITADFNSDGWPDIYVANDGHGNFLWINQQNGTFVEEAVLSGVAYDGVGQGQGSMGLALADINLDAKPDIFVTNLDGEPIAVYESRQEDFVEVSHRNGVLDASFGSTGFGIALFDADNDGNPDLAAANGRVRRQRNPLVTGSRSADTRSADMQSADRKQPSRRMTAVRSEEDMLNEYRESSTLMSGSSSGFRTVESDDHTFPGIPGAARSLCAGDFDNDGRIDLLVTYLDRSVGVFRNTTETTGHWVQFTVTEPSHGGRDAIGAVITLTVSGEQKMTRWLHGGGSYQCVSDFRVHFGLGDADRFDSVEVMWPGGERERFPGGRSDRFLQLRRGEGESLP